MTDSVTKNSISFNQSGKENRMIKIDKIRKCMITALMAMSLLTVTACGAKKDMASNKAAANIEQSTETATVAKAKDMQMQVKDADGNTVTLTGDATINEAGEMVFEGKDSAGTDTGKNDNTTDVTKPAEGNNTGNTAETPAPDNKQDNTGNSSTSDTTPSTPEHTHTWNPVTTTVHHEATGHYTDVVVGTRTVVDKEAWDEPVYEWKYMGKTRCKGCGQVFNTASECFDHQDEMADNGDYTHGSYESIAEKVQTDTIHHEAETHEEDIKEKQWVEDTAAYDETVITGYTCSCGATK